MKNAQKKFKRGRQLSMHAKRVLQIAYLRFYEISVKNDRKMPKKNENRI